MTKEEAIKYLQQLYPNGGHCWLDEQRIEAIGMAVKALKEEPVSTKDKLLALSDGRLHLGWIDDAKVVEFEECLMQFHEDMNNIPQGTDSLTRLKDTDGVLHSYSKKLMSMAKEESVSEELEEASKEWLRQQLDKSYANYGEAKMMELTHFDGYAMLDAIEFGAKWKEEQFEKNRLAACDRQTEEEAEREQDFVMGIIENEHRKPTFNDAIKYGMRLQRENMMKDAVECTICASYENPYGGFTQLVDSKTPLVTFEKEVKLIIIKEKL